MFYAVEKWNAKIEAWQQVDDIIPANRKWQAENRFENLKNRFDFEHFRLIQIINESY